MAHCLHLQHIHGTLLALVSMAHCLHLKRIHGTLLTLETYPWHIAYTCNIPMAHCLHLQHIHGTLFTLATYPWHIAYTCNISMAHCWHLQHIHGTLLTLATYPWHIAYTQPPNYSNSTQHSQFKCTLKLSSFNKLPRISRGRCFGLRGFLRCLGLCSTAGRHRRFGRIFRIRPHLSETYTSWHSEKYVVFQTGL